MQLINLKLGHHDSALVRAGRTANYCPVAMRAPPLVYHPRYSCPWPAAHRFPMWKFADLFDVVQRQRWYSPALVHTPTPLPSSAFTAVHQEAYYRAFSAGILDDDAARRIGFRGEIANPALIERTKLEVAGTELVRVRP